MGLFCSTGVYTGYRTIKAQVPNSKPLSHAYNMFSSLNNRLILLDDIFYCNIYILSDLTSIPGWQKFFFIWIQESLNNKLMDNQLKT